MRYPTAVPLSLFFALAVLAAPAQGQWPGGGGGSSGGAPEAGEFGAAAALNDVDGSLDDGSVDTLAQIELCNGLGVSVLETDDDGDATCKDSTQTTISGSEEDGDMLLWDTNSWRDVPMSGDASMLKTGAVTVTSPERTYRDECNITFESAVTADDIMCGKATGALTLISLDCVATGDTVPDSQVVTVVECDADGDSCSTTGGTISAEALITNYPDATWSDAAIADGNWWGIQTTSLTTAADFLQCQVEFTRAD
jgi:hypothetical protein